PRKPALTESADSLVSLAKNTRFWSRFCRATSAPNALNLHYFDFERTRLLTSKTADRDKAHSASNAISPQQERTPSGPRPCSMVRSCRSSVSLTYQAICYVVIQAKGTFVLNYPRENKLGLPKGAAGLLCQLEWRHIHGELSRPFRLVRADDDGH